MTVITPVPPQWRKHEPPPEGFVAASSFADVITYRQLDYWTRTGHLHASADSGAGYDRLWPAGEIRVARATKALLDAGFGLAVAREISRNGKPGETFELAAGIRIECSAALWGDE